VGEHNVITLSGPWSLFVTGRNEEKQPLFHKELIAVTTSFKNLHAQIDSQLLVTLSGHWGAKNHESKHFRIENDILNCEVVQSSSMVVTSFVVLLVS
jgi:hypothetical protein